MAEALAFAATDSLKGETGLTKTVTRPPYSGFQPDFGMG